jgi:secondary thiamine-phosphate synthase enzyme
MIERLVVETRGKGIYDVTPRVAEAVARSGLREGLCTVMIQHTSASLTIQENYDPTARRDLEGWLERLVPEDDPHFTHQVEGPDDMPSHIKAALTSTTLSIPIVDGKLALGTWQGLFLWEHRAAGRARSLVLHLGP